jgi:hypothetical protein
MMAFAATDPDVLSTNRSVHLRKVEEENFAYISDRTPLLMQALLNDDCKLVVMPEGFMPMPYGLAIKKGSPYLEEFKLA